MRNVIIILILLSNITLLAQQPPMNKSVTITAKAEQEVSPDQVVYSINITQKRNTFEEAYNALDKEINKAIDILLKEDIKKKAIKTTAYNVQKNYSWSNNKRQDDGFLASSRMEAKNALDTRKINKVLARFGKESPDLNLNIGFAISDDLLESMNDVLLTKAIKRAKNKAKLICDALDKKLGEIVTVDYSEVSSQRPVYFQKNMANARAMSASDEHGAIENVKEIKLDLSVHTVWSID